jgi:hypothetical protein
VFVNMIFVHIFLFPGRAITFVTLAILDRMVILLLPA